MMERVTYIQQYIKVEKEKTVQLVSALSCLFVCLFYEVEMGILVKPGNLGW